MAAFKYNFQVPVLEYLHIVHLETPPLSLALTRCPLGKCLTSVISDISSSPCLWVFEPNHHLHQHPYHPKQPYFTGACLLQNKRRCVNNMQRLNSHPVMVRSNRVELLVLHRSKPHFLSILVQSSDRVSSFHHKRRYRTFLFSLCALFSAPRPAYRCRALFRFLWLLLSKFRFPHIDVIQGTSRGFILSGEPTHPPYTCWKITHLRFCIRYR